MSIIQELRQKIFGTTRMADRMFAPLVDIGVPGQKMRTRADLYEEFLGKTLDEQAEHIAQVLIPDSVKDADKHREARKHIFTYLVKFLHSSTFEVGLHVLTGKGINLARRPYLAPTGLVYVKEDKEDNKKILPVMDLLKDQYIEHRGAFRFQEQYRWDTYFQNKFLLLIGAHDLAINQLLNLVDVYNAYGRIPNALTSDFLSHPQPPFETMAAHDILHTMQQYDDPPPWFDQVMQTAEKELVTEWWDDGGGRIHPRQDRLRHDPLRIKSAQDGKKKTFYFYDPEKMPYWTRYVSVHYHSLLVGCQDGKDHHRLTSFYGEDYLSVQLHSLIWGMLNHLLAYYEKRPDGKDRAKFYAEAVETMREHINGLMWDESAPVEGAFRNYSLRDGAPIDYGDLSAEIFPLFVGLANDEQAQAIKRNLETYYEGDIGLATTSLMLRVGGPLASEVPGWPDKDSQWELNAWPPLMMVAVEGLLHKNYAHLKDLTDLATRLQKKWVAWLEHEFETDQPQTRTFHEKAPYDTKAPVGEGFYGNLPGFGWTIASYATFLHRIAQIDGALDEVENRKRKFNLACKKSQESVTRGAV